MENVPVAIDVQNLSKTYPSKPEPVRALKKISLGVPLGQICVILGPNGSGKTTLLKILAGLLSPSSGSVSILNMNPAEQPYKVKQQIGWMPADERSGFYGRLTGNENLEFFASLYGVPPSELDRKLGNLGLLLGFENELDQKMLNVSSGNRQKLGLARILLHDPNILILDEPFRNLDPHTTLRLRRLLRDHLTRNKEKTVLLSTHQLDEAARVADSLIIINKGTIIRQLDPLQLKDELKKGSLEDYYMHAIDKGSPV